MHLDVIVLEEEEDRIECVSADFSYIAFGDLGECEAGTSLQVNVVRIDEGAESVERRSREEIGLGSVLKVALKHIRLASIPIAVRQWGTNPAVLPLLPAPSLPTQAHRGCPWTGLCQRANQQSSLPFLSG